MTNKKLVNWVDGMSLSSSTFNQQDNYCIDMIRDSIAIRTTHYNYGILPMNTKEGKQQKGIIINKNIMGHVEVRLEQCSGITSSGIKFNYDSKEVGKSLQKEYSMEEDIKKGTTQWEIILSVNPFDRKGTGEILQNVVPPRHTNAEFSYSLFVMPAGELNTAEFGDHFLTIGRILKEVDNYIVDEKFIPPCTSMKSHAVLVEYYATFERLLKKLEGNNKKIISKIHDRSNKSELANNISGLCRDMLRYIGSIYFNYTNKCQTSAPIDTIEIISGLAHTLYLSLEFLHGIHKEEVLKYFYEWNNTSPGAFEELLSQTLNLKYEHNDIRKMMEYVDRILSTIDSLWERMSSLEYIGQHKENLIISEKSMGGGNITPTQSWSVMD